MGDADRAMQQLLDGVVDGQSVRHQLAPDEGDPVSNETADEAWQTFQKRKHVNPFHAVELQRQQDEERAKQPCQNCGHPVEDGTEDGRYCGLMCAMEDSNG